MPSHEFPQLELQDQDPPEDDHALDAVESANQDEVTTEEQPPELGVEQDTGELGRSDGDRPVFEEEPEGEFVESAGQQAEEQEVTHAEQDGEHENDDHHSASLADDQHPEAEDQEYSQDGTEGEEGNYDEEEEEDDEESDATTEVPEVDEVAENELVEANDAFDQPPEEVYPTVDEASEQLEESTAQAVGSPRLTDNGLFAPFSQTFTD